MGKLPSPELLDITGGRSLLGVHRLEADLRPEAQPLPAAELEVAARSIAILQEAEGAVGVKRDDAHRCRAARGARARREGRRVVRLRGPLRARW